MGEVDPDVRAQGFAAEAIGAGDPTGWFERLYAGAEVGEEVVPWDRGSPHRFLVQWAAARRLSGGGRRALVVGCGLGDDAEYVAGRGFDTVAFDISASAIRAAQRRYPDSAVHFVTADLLDPPAEWERAFGLVVENMTLQALPDPPRATAIANVGRPVAPGGTLFVHARSREQGDPDDGPPWALTRAEIEAVAASGLDVVRIEDAREPGARRWLAEFRRPGGRSRDARRREPASRRAAPASGAAPGAGLGVVRLPAVLNGRTGAACGRDRPAAGGRAIRGWELPGQARQALSWVAGPLAGWCAGGGGVPGLGGGLGTVQ
jgi:SAM-dependent methyltransferase